MRSKAPALATQNPAARQGARSRGGASLERPAAAASGVASTGTADRRQAKLCKWRSAGGWSRKNPRPNSQTADRGTEEKQGSVAHSRPGRMKNPRPALSRPTGGRVADRQL